MQKKSLTLVSKKVLAVQQLALSSIIIPMGTLTADRKIPNAASIIVPIHSVVMETIWLFPNTQSIPSHKPFHIKMSIVPQNKL